MEHSETVEKYLGFPGRMITGSKSGYRRTFPDNKVVFNANLYADRVKVWWGDLDLTLDEKLLKELQAELGCEVIVLREMDGRFENEETPNFENPALILS